MARGGIAAAAVASPQGKSKNNTTNRWKGKRKVVNPGDIVQFRACNSSMTGNVGVVLGYVNKREFIVRTFGGADTDYGPMYISVWDQEPNSNFTDSNGDNLGHRNWYYSNWIMNIVHSDTPKKKKVKKPVQFHEVTHEELPAVLSGQQTIPAGHKVVLVPTVAP